MNKRPKRSAIDKARYALAKAPDYLRSKDALAMLGVVLPALKGLQDVDDYADLQALLNVWIGIANLMLGDAESFEERIHQAYMLAEEPEEQQMIENLRYASVSDLLTCASSFSSRITIQPLILIIRPPALIDPAICVATCDHPVKGLRS